MKIALILAALALTAMVVMPATADLTDYQKGVAEGLKIGFFMGNLSGFGHCSIEAARSYNANLDQFNNWLAKIFDQNETMLNSFGLNPLIFNDPANVADQLMYSEPRIAGYPADAYYTATGTGSAGDEHPDYLSKPP
jgi:hypothetical protein